MSFCGRIVAAAVLCAALACKQPAPAPDQARSIGAPPTPTETAERLLKLPRKAGSVRFALIGDSGRGDLPQYEVSTRIQAFRRAFPFDFVVMVGDNIYDGWTPDDYRRKFEQPYKPLLDDGVKFFAVIGNHDDAAQPAYGPFHMEGQRYYTFVPPSLVSRVLGAKVRFFMIDTERVDRTQMTWFDQELTRSDADWNIAVFHRPIYTSGRYQYGARDLRRWIEPVLLKHDVPVVFSGHEHFYERTKPQRGITYFISGAAGSLRVGDIRPSLLTEVGFDRDYSFMLIEIEGDELYFQSLTRAGATVDYGVIKRQPPPHVGEDSH